MASRSGQDSICAGPFDKSIVGMFAALMIGEQQKAQPRRLGFISSEGWLLDRPINNSLLRSDRLYGMVAVGNRCNRGRRVPCGIGRSQGGCQRSRGGVQPES